MEFLGVRGRAYIFKIGDHWLFERDEMICVAETAIKEGLIDPRDYLPKEESKTVLIDPFYGMRSKAINFWKSAREEFGGATFSSNDEDLKHLIHKFYFNRWSDSLKILKERGMATYEKNEKGRIVNIRLLF
jgi:hypothetical protein